MDSVVYRARVALWLLKTDRLISAGDLIDSDELTINIDEALRLGLIEKEITNATSDRSDEQP